MKTLFATAGAMLALTAGSAHAQDVPPEPTVQVPEPVQTAPVPPSDPPVDPNAMRTFSDGEIAAFAMAAREMQALRDDEEMPDEMRQAQAEAIVAEAGLDPETYRAIGRAAQADPALAMRVQEAMAALEEEPGN